MPQFKIQINRKAWNEASKWLYKEAKRLADNAESEGVTTVKEFASSLSVSLGGKVMLGRMTPAFRRGAQSIEIGVWNDDRFAGINKKNSTSGAALTISIEQT